MKNRQVGIGIGKNIAHEHVLVSPRPILVWGGGLQNVDLQFVQPWVYILHPYFVKNLHLQNLLTKCNQFWINLKSTIGFGRLFISLFDISTIIRRNSTIVVMR